MISFSGPYTKGIDDDEKAVVFLLGTSSWDMKRSGCVPVTIQQQGLLGDWVDRVGRASKNKDEKHNKSGRSSLLRPIYNSVVVGLRKA